MKILVTCPPMLGMKEQFLPLLAQHGVEAVCPEVIQTLTEEQLIELVPQCDGWIIGDDPATERVFTAGKAGNLKAAVKWGIGVDNVDFGACKKLDIPITNTPNMFGEEVADVAIGYLIALARETFFIDRGIREGYWPKNRGISLAGKTAGVIGFGDIGSQTVRRLQVMGMNVIVWDPAFTSLPDSGASLASWPERAEECDFLLFTCSLNRHNQGMLNANTLSRCKPGVRIVNVARGPLIDEPALVEALLAGHVHSAALDVFVSEPLPANSPLRNLPLCVFGSHNSSNTSDAVARTNIRAIDSLLRFLGVST